MKRFVWTTSIATFIVAGIVFLGSVSSVSANERPVASATVSVMNTSSQQNTRSITVQKGAILNISVDASASSDPDGWTTSAKGVSAGGRCQVGIPWNGSPWQGNAVSRTTNSPSSPSSCSGTFTVQFDLAPGGYQLVLLQIIDASGAVSATTSNNILNVTVVDTPVNAPPIARSRVSINGGPFVTNFSVQQGQTVSMVIDASQTTDPDGWTTPGKGVANGGRCEMYASWNSNPLLKKVVNNPPNPSACTYGPFQTTFNGAVGHYNQSVLVIVDASGAQNLPSLNDRLDFTITDPNPNQPPVAVVQWAAPVSGNGTPHITVNRGVPIKILGLASSSSDPDGWATDVSNGGKCEWNTDLNRGVPTYERSIPNPGPPGLGSCDHSFGTLTFNDTPGTYTYSLLRITDKKGAQSVGTATITVAGAVAINNNPVAVAKFRLNGGTPQSNIVVSRGVPVRIGLDASSSFDPNGWNAAATGVSQGGKCEWNTNLDQSSPTSFVRVISNPSSPSSCNVDLGTLTFNDRPGTYTYVLLRITDAGGLRSIISAIDTRSRFALSRLIPSVFAQGSDGSASVTVVEGPTPTPSPTPSSIAKNASTPTSTPTPTPSCNPFGYNSDCSTPTPTPVTTLEPSPSDTPTATPVVPTDQPTIQPDPCSPESADCGGIVETVASVIKEIGEPVATAVTNIVAALMGVTPVEVMEFVRENGVAVATTLAMTGTALSAPLIATNILPQFVQWGRFLGFFGIRKRKDRWGIVVDSDLGTPIARAVVQVFDATFNQLKETQITGSDGQFGFLLPPGKYYLVANIAGFTFPARKKPPLVLQENERVYLGEEFILSDENPENIPHIIVPMDRETQVSAVRTMFARYMEILVSIIDRIGFAFLIIGGTTNTYLLLLYPSILNICFEVLYLVLFAFKLYVLAFHKREVGNVIDSVTKQKLDLAIVRLYDVKTNRIIQTRVTNKDGKFFLILPRGTYTASVARPGYETSTINNLVIKGSKSQAISMDFALKPLA